MSTAEPRRGAGRAGAGFTFIEMVVVTAIVGLATLMVERTVSSLTDTERTMRAVRNTAERGQRVLYQLRDIVAASRKLYGNEAVGNGYLAKLDLARWPRLVGSRLPTFDEVNPLGPDEAGAPKTGNVLLFVREADPAPCVAYAPTKTIRLIDTYRFVCAYLTQATRSVVAGQPAALDLVIWRSKAYPNLGQVQGIASLTQRRAVVKELYTRFGHDYLWDPNAPVDASFYGIDALGNVAASPSVLSKVPEDPKASWGPRFVAANMAVARTDLSSTPRKPVFSAEPLATWTPNGFEVKVVGTSGARKVWLRLCVEQQAAAGRVPAFMTTAVASTRDM